MAAIDDLRSLQDSLAGRTGALDPAFQSLQGLNGAASGALGSAIANQNTGLAPDVMSALRTQATSGINDQYQSAAQALNSQLLRRGAVGQAQLPGSGGDISRAYQPLYSAMEAAKTKATTDTILADQAQRNTNNQLALSAANNVFGNQISAFNAGNSAITGAAGIANDIGNLETPNLLKLLGTAGLTSLISGGIGGSGGAGGLLTGTGTNSTGKFGVLGDAFGKLFGGSSSSNPLLDSISNGTFGGATAPYSGDPTVAGLGDAAQGVADQYGSLLKDLGTYGGNATQTAGTSAADTAGEVGGGATAAIETAAKTAGQSVTGLLGSAGKAVTGLLTNPWTAVAGAVVLGAVAWVKSQAHWEANTWVQGFQNPFDQKMWDVATQVSQLKASGQYTPEVADQMKTAAQEAISGYLQKLDTFYREKGTNSDQGKVAAQAYQTFLKYYGQDGSGYLNMLAA